MIKFLPVGVLILLVLGASWFLITKQSQNFNLSSPPTEQQPTVTQSKPVPLAAAASPVSIPQKVNNDTSSTNIATLESKVSSLEDKVTALQRQVSQVGTGASLAPAETTVASKKSPIYIPLGWVASSSVMDWTTVATQSVIIDTNDYPGATSAQFEGRIVNYQGNGTCYARIINTTDGTAVLGSQISTSGTDYAWVTSPGFSLASGKKTYAVQLKTNTGYSAQISDAHLKINF